MRFRLLSFLALVSGIGAPLLMAQQPPDPTPYLMPDRADEVALARSAAPASVSDRATVMVLGRSGFVPAARGENGFTCLVARSFAGRLDDPDFWNPRVRAPHCFNPEASRTVLVEMLKRAEWVLAGVPLPEIAARTHRAYASHELPAPAPGSMAYMTSRGQHLQDADPHHWMPHLMLYFDKSLPAADWGAGGFSAPVIDAAASDPHAEFLTLLVPVQRWSDGTLALEESAHH